MYNAGASRHTQPAVNLEVIFLGDSHARRLATRLQPPIKIGNATIRHQATHNATRSGLGRSLQDDVVWLRRHANSLSGSSAKFVVVSFGSNCVTRSKTDERVVENLETVIDTCVSAIQDTIKAVECCKDAHVFVMSAVPCKKATPEATAAFGTLNQRLGQAAAARGCTFLDPAEVVGDGGVIPESAYVDEVHLGADAHDKLWKIILNHIWGPLLQRCLQ